MQQRILVLICLLPIFSFSQERKGSIKLTSSEYASFPRKFEVTQKVFEYYYDIGFTNKKLNDLNEAQKVLCYHFLCDGMIGNWSFFVENSGEYNAGYLKSLELLGDANDQKILDELVSIYKKYEKWFSKGEYPPTLDEDSKQFNKKENATIEMLQQKWSENSGNRELLFEEYLKRNKSELVKE